MKLEEEGEHKRGVDGRSITNNIYQAYLLCVMETFFELIKCERALVCAVKEVNADKTETDLTYAITACR